MNKQSAVPSVGEVLEQIFAGLASVAIVTFVAVGTVAMCLARGGGLA